jgi:hypothetical protein
MQLLPRSPSTIGDLKSLEDPFVNGLGWKVNGKSIVNHGHQQKELSGVKLRHFDCFSYSPFCSFTHETKMEPQHITISHPKIIKTLHNSRRFQWFPY